MGKTTEEEKAEQAEDEIWKDRIEGAAEEWEIVKEARPGKKEARPGKKSNVFTTISNKEPSREQKLLREEQEAAIEWEESIRAKYMEGVVIEMIGVISECLDEGKEFPPKSELHKWTDEMVDDAKVGFSKFKATFELADKYPLESAEQFYDEDTKKWVMLDFSALKNKVKGLKNESEKTETKKRKEPGNTEGLMWSES